MPPLPSNFLQRIGRAGRKSGDALIVNFAKNQNHDLYYYADPLQMMEGEVNTPGCYLEAKDILKRHFTAYCFDCWAGENPNENNIPSFVRDLKLQARNLNEREFFVNRLSKFIKENRLSLVSDFLKQYEKRIKEQVFPEIAQQMDSGQFYDHLLDVFEKIKNELDQIRERGKDIDSQIKLLNLAKGDPLFDEFLREKRNLRGVRKAIQSRNVLEHLTNVGVLPNYAFPETGVHLTAHVLSSSIEGSPNRSLDQDFEIVRPAVQAIKEFAPENYFYTQGYRFEISGVNTFDWSDKDVLQAKRFCSKCDYIENDIKAKGGNCPKCGDPSWSSATNKHQFAKLLSVKSFNSESKAILTDANDDRDIQNYHLMHFVNMNPETSAGALVLKDIPFGIEYVKNATITSVNFGRVDENDVRKVKINDTEVLTKGFVTCKYCGKSISATHLAKESKDYHYGYCKHRDIKYKPGETDEVFEEIYFFREMHTEVLKMVLPVQEFNTEADVRMFQAGLEIGLKQYFRGNPQHLRVLPYREYNQKTDKFDRFLLLYDTIPGGTGYLEQLFNQEEFTLLLKLSYETIRDCTCQLDGYDGCYKCIYSYGNQYQREDLSRKRAEEWFAKIYSKTEEWVPYSTGLTSVTNTGKIEESELEERFIKLLKLFVEMQENHSLIENKDSGTVHYELRIDKDDVKAMYWIRPQINLGQKDGIAYSTRVDFLIVCGEYLYKGKDYHKDVPKIALYLDGYQYHASNEHNVFEKDINIRQAIVAQPEYRSWTLTWNDLDRFVEYMEDKAKSSDLLSEHYQAYFQKKYLEILLPRMVSGEKINYAFPHNNVLRLWHQLLYPQIKIFESSWFTYLGSWTKEMFNPSFDPSKLSDLIDGTLSDGNYIRENRITDFNALLPVEYESKFGFASWSIWVNIGKRTLYHHLQLQTGAEVDKGEWENFWHLFNLFQFSTSFTVEMETDVNAIFKEISDYYSQSYHPLLQKAIEAGYIHDGNYEMLDSLIDEDGNLIADASLILTAIKIAVDPYTDESRKILESLGYTIYSEKQLNEIEL